jgi:hypothetical protein
MKPPPVPSKKKFPDPKIHQAKKELHTTIRDTLMKLYNISKGGRAEMVMKFIGMINPGNNPDPSRLPYLSKSGRAIRESKIECVIASVSWIIQQYWEFYTTGKEKLQASILVDLGTLEELIDAADESPVLWFHFKVIGDEREGYQLVRK